MQPRWLAAATLVLLGACHREPDPPPSPSTAAATARPPVRDAVGDKSLRVMLAELASSKACALMKGQFRPLRDPQRHDVVTGTLWIRSCEITNQGTRVTFHLAGNGWQWVDQSKRKAGATFVVREYVKFGVDIVMPGALDIAYDDATHVVSLWFSPERSDVTFHPVGDVAVDRKGTWSSIVGALSSALGSSPEHQAGRQATDQGTQQFHTELADGLAVTINLCTGLSRFNLGRPPRGAMQPADAGESRTVAVELQPGALMVFGPQLAPDGMTIAVDARRGAVRIAMACADKAEQLAEAYVAGQRGEAPYLATADVHGRGRLHVAPQRCPVAVIARPLDDTVPTTFDWQRPLDETARSTGGPLIQCPATGRASDRPDHTSGAVR
jgi:hypothetical protein